jgi:allantoate deiminase
MMLAGKIPSAMLFLRTPGGLSHHPDESVALPDVQAALETCMRLLETLTH